MFNKKYKLGSILMLFFSIIFFAPFFQAKAYDNMVTDRELLMLAILSYDNAPQKDTSQMGNEKFNSKWFGEFGDPSELVEWETVDYIINKDIENMNGFSVVTYRKRDNLVIAFRGTDSGLVKENWKYFIARNQHPQAKYISGYIDRLKEYGIIQPNTKIYLAGHSLGGYLTIFALGQALLDEDLKDKVVRAVTFNGLGLGYIKDKALNKVLSNADKNLLVNYAVKGDVVSIIGRHFTPIKYVKLVLSKNKNMPAFVNGNAHFPYSFFHSRYFMKNS